MTGFSTSIIWRIASFSSPGFSHRMPAPGYAPPLLRAVPRAHHPHIRVVEDEDFDRQPMLHGGRHLLHGHQHRGLARDIDDERFRLGHLAAARGRPTITP